MSTGSNTTVPEVTPDRLRTILDVRPREQYGRWHVPGSRHVEGGEALKAGQEGVKPT